MVSQAEKKAIIVAKWVFERRGSLSANELSDAQRIRETIIMVFYIIILVLAQLIYTNSASVGVALRDSEMAGVLVLSRTI